MFFAGAILGSFLYGLLVSKNDYLDIAYYAPSPLFIYSMHTRNGRCKLFPTLVIPHFPFAIHHDDDGTVRLALQYHI